MYSNAAFFKYYREEAGVILMPINADTGIQTAKTKRGCKEKAGFLMTNLYFQVAVREIVFCLKYLITFLSIVRTNPYLHYYIW